MANDAAAIIQAELATISRKKATSSGVMICCPFHNDNTPSLSVNTHDGKVAVGVFYCFGCGEKGRWNKLAEKMGLRKVSAAEERNSSHSSPPLLNGLMLVQDPLADAVSRWELDFVEDWPKTKAWRGFPGSFLSTAMSARIAVNPNKDSEVLLLPVNVMQELRGVVMATLVKSKVSYMNSPGEWTRDYGLLGHDLAVRMLESTPTLFLVEGPRDVLRLLYYGVPAVALLGAASWGPQKINTVLGMTDSIVAWTDSDAAGVKATNRIVKTLSSIEVDYVNSRKLAKAAGHKIDPANAPLDVFKRVLSPYCKPKAGAYRDYV